MVDGQLPRLGESGDGQNPTDGADPLPIESAEIVLSASDGHLTVLDYQSENSLIFSRSDSEDHEVLVRRRGGINQELPQQGAESVQVAGWAGDGVVFSTVPLDGVGPHRVYWWPAEGLSSTVLWESSPDRAGGDLAVVSEEFFTTWSTEAESCIARWDITGDMPQEDEHRWECVGANEALWWLQSDGKGLSWLRHSSRDAGEKCNELWWRSDSAPAQRVATTGCVTRGQANEHGAVWSGEPAVGEDGSEDWFDGPLYALQDGREIELGRAAIGSGAVCEELVAWFTEAEEPVIGILDLGSGSRFEYLGDPGDIEGRAGKLFSAPSCAGMSQVGFHSATVESRDSEFLVVNVPSDKT